MSLSEYRFDLTALWDDPATQIGYGAVAIPDTHSPCPLTRRTRSAVGTVGVSEYPTESQPRLKLVEPASQTVSSDLGVAMVEYLLNAHLHSLKTGKRAVKRCRSRMRRLMRDLNADLAAMRDPALGPAAGMAATQFANAICAKCAKCDGA